MEEGRKREGKVRVAFHTEKRKKKCVLNSISDFSFQVQRRKIKIQTHKGRSGETDN
jgi:hypothetical protein